jgi:hypothetical protein
MSEYGLAPDSKKGMGFTKSVDLTTEQAIGESPLAGRIDSRSPEGDRRESIANARQEVDQAHRRAEGQTDPEADEPTHEKSLLDEAYESLKADESRPPNLDQIIAIRGRKGGGLGLREDQPEYAILLDRGVSAEALASGHITRGQLLGEGQDLDDENRYIFLNRIGGGEKPIIGGEIPDPDDPENTLDFTNRVLLTRQEVDKVYRHQLAHPDIFGTQGQDLDEVRKDMLLFLQDAIAEPPYGYEAAFLQVALPYKLNESVRLDEHALSNDDEFEQAQRDWELVENYWNWQVEHYEEINPDTPLNDLQIKMHLQQVFSRQFCADIYTWPGDVETFGIKDVRDHRINRAIPQRRKRLAGQASPFLESGFVFGDNPDAEVIVELPSGKFGKRRLNMGNLHLFGAHPDFPGFGEVGGVDDQVYMTLGTYVDTLYEKDAAKREALQAQEVAKLQTVPISQVISQYQERLVAMAKAWSEAQLSGGQDDLTRELQELDGADIEAVQAQERIKQEEEITKDPWL